MKEKVSLFCHVEPKQVGASFKGSKESLFLHVKFDAFSETKNS